MSRSLRPAVFLLALLLASLPLSAGAPPPRTPPSKPPHSDADLPDLGGTTLRPQKRPFVSHLDAARRAIDDKDWPVATTLLQKVLDLPEDALVRRTPRESGGKEMMSLTSLQGEASRMVGALPAAGRDF